MRDYILEFAKNIIYYLMLVTVIMQLLPESANKKYVKLYSGLVFILAFFTPLMDLTGKAQEVNIKSTFSTYEQEVQDMLDSAELFQEKQQETVLSNYYGIIETDIAERLEKYGMNVERVLTEIEMDSDSEEYGNIIGITVECEESGHLRSEAIKEELAYVYGVQTEQISFR